MIRSVASLTAAVSFCLPARSERSTGSPTFIVISLRGNRSGFLAYGASSFCAPHCPTGITGSPEIFKGHPEHTKAYLVQVADETRALLAQMGFKHVREIVGRSDATDVLIDDRPVPYARELWLPLVWFLIPR